MSQILLAAYPSVVFSPADISGLKLWLKAATIGGSDNDPVSSWLDSSGTSNNASQATSGFRPLYKTNIVNSLPVVRFDGTDDYMSFGTSPGTVCTAFVVAALGDVAANQIAFAIILFTPGIWLSARVSSTNWGSFTGNGEMSAGEVLTNGTFNDLEVTSTTSGSPETKLYRNGTQKASTGASCTGASGQFIGADANGAPIRFFKGDIAEIIMYDTVLSSGNRASVEAYLATKYAL